MIFTSFIYSNRTTSYAVLHLAGEDKEAPQVRVVFEGEMKKRFEAIKRYYGLEKNADLVRLLITLRYEELKKEGKI